MTYYDDADYANNIGYVPDDIDMHSVMSYHTNISGFPGGSVDSRSKNNRKLMEDMKLADKGYQCVKRKVMRGEVCKTAKIEYYTTNYTPGIKIRDAITGMRYKHLVGSRDEDLFFKVRLSNGETGSDPPLLFYESPESYEKHQHCALSDTIKSVWREKFNAEVLKRKYENDTYNYGDMTVIH